MNSKTLYSLKVFQLFSCKCKSLFLHSCPKELICFLCKCWVNLLKANLQSIKWHHLTNFQNEVWLLCLKRLTWKQKRDLLASEKNASSLKSLPLPSSVIYPDMEQFVLVPVSVHNNKNLSIQSFVSCQAGTSKMSSFTKPTYQVDPLKKVLNNKLSAKGDSLVEKIL